MKRKSLFRLASFVICLFLIVSIIPVARAEEVTRYGYTQLGNDNQKAAYDAIVKGIGALEVQIEIAVSGASVDDNFQDVIYAAQMVAKDYPEFFWYHWEFELEGSETTVIFRPVGYSVDGVAVTAGSDALIAAQNKLDAVISEVMDQLPKNPSDYEIAHTIHDYIVQRVSYVQTGDHQTAYGALVRQEAVCAGYARAYQLLMNQAGISCWYVEGSSYAPDGNLIAHAWNLVWLDGMCYYSDATWDDQNGELFHEYLNMSLEEISKTHFTSDPLPASCGHDTYTFFRMNSGEGVCDIRDHKQASDVADCFVLKHQEGSYAEYYCTIHYHADDFSQWIDDNIIAIAEELGYVGSLGYNMIELGHEHHVTLYGEIQIEETEPPTQPTEPETEPTQPTEPETEPTQPTEPETEPPTQPTEPETEPTQPTEPETEPTQPTEPETEPPTQPTEPETEPPTQPTEPETEPPTQPAEPETEPSAEPSVPETEPSVAPSESVPDAPTQTIGSESASTEHSTQSAPPASTSVPDESDPDKPNQSDSRSWIIVAVCAVGIAVTGVVLFVAKKKKNT